MNNYLDRLITEESELDVKLVALTAFNKTEPFYNLSLDAQNDLNEQLYTMSQYSGILRTRIAKGKNFYSGYIANQPSQSQGAVCGSSQHLIEPENT